MAEERTKRRTRLALNSALGVALLVIAFLLGRESTRIRSNSDAHVGEAAPSVPSPGAPDLEPAPERFVDSARIERRPDGTIVLSNISDHEDAGAEAPPRAKAASAAATPIDTPEAVAGYFTEVDAIRSGEDVGDPNTFAMGLLKAGMSGSTAGFDQLITDTKQMEEQLQGLTPPPSCQRYHEVNLEALADGRTILEDLKSALSTKDIAKLTAVAQQARTLETRANQLEKMEKELRPTP